MVARGATVGADWAGDATLWVVAVVGVVRMKKQDFNLDTSFKINVSDFSEIPEEEQKNMPLEITESFIIDTIEPMILNGCCCDSGCC